MKIETWATVTQFTKRTWQIAIMQSGSYADDSPIFCLEHRYVMGRSRADRIAERMVTRAQQRAIWKREARRRAEVVSRVATPPTPNKETGQ